MVQQTDKWLNLCPSLVYVRKSSFPSWRFWSRSSTFPLGTQSVPPKAWACSCGVLSPDPPSGQRFCVAQTCDAAAATWTASSSPRHVSRAHYRSVLPKSRPGFIGRAIDGNRRPAFRHTLVQEADMWGGVETLIPPLQEAGCWRGNACHELARFLATCSPTCYLLNHTEASILRPDSRETAGIPVPAGAGQIGLDGDSMRPRLSLQTPQVSDEVFNRLNQTNLEQGCGGVTL